MFKAPFVATSLLLILGCTSTYNIRYLVTTTDPGGIVAEDIKAISESLLNDRNIDPASGPSTFYLSKHIDAWEILRVESSDSSLFLSVTRLTKRLASFSENWKAFFVSKMKNIIENATKKTVELQQVLD